MLAVASTARSRPDAVLERKRIFVVDDDPEMIDLLMFSLRYSDFDIVPFSSGGALLEHLADGMLGPEHWLSGKGPKSTFVMPDAVVLDVRMPGVSGLEILRSLHASEPSTPVVIITAQRDRQTRADALRHGATTILFKPLDLVELTYALHVAMDLYSE